MMTLPVLPDFVMLELEGYAETPDFGVKRTDMDGGIPKQRPTRSLAIISRSVSLLVDGEAQKAAFDAWYRLDIAGGSGWFTATLFGRVMRIRFADKTTWRLRQRNKWSCAATLETIG